MSRAGARFALVAGALLLAGCMHEPAVTTVSVYNEGSTTVRVHVTFTEEGGVVAQEMIFPVGPANVEERKVKMNSLGPFTVEAFTESGLRAPERGEDVLPRGHLFQITVNETALQMQVVKLG